LQRIWLIALVCILLSAATTIAQEDGEEQAQPEAAVKMAELEGRLQQLQDNVQDLETNYSREIDDRDRLMLQRRFVEGREFHYLLHDYRGAAEVFYGVVHHPMATTLPNYLEAAYYLADSLFQSGFYGEAKIHFEILYNAGKNDFYGMSLLRLIQIAVVMRDYGEADRLYAQLLADFPENEDGSLGRYIIGKAFYLRGETDKAIEIFDSIPETGNYYATAQYYVAVIYVKQQNYKEAVNRFRRLKQSLQYDQANKKKLYALTHLALGRIYYELNDFPQAMARYSSVDPESPEYARSQYESMWVFITRNDYLLKAIDDERNNYEELLFDHAEFRDSVAAEEEQEGMQAIADEVEALQTDIDEIKDLFTEIDDSLARLQEEALTSYNNLVKSAPNDQLLPEAELLVGNIYAQVENYETAEQWFVKTKDRYDNFYAGIAAARPNLSAGDQLALLEAGTDAWAGDEAAVNPTILRGMPAETAYWLAAKPQLKQLFAVYRGVLAERDNLDKMSRMVDEIEVQLRILDSGADGYPILREAHRKSIELQNNIQGLQVEFSGLRTFGGGVAGQAAAHEGTLRNLQSRLAELDAKIDAKRAERLAFYRQEVSRLRAPLSEMGSSVEALLSVTQSETARIADAELQEIEAQVYDYAQRADLGIIDVAWRATRGSNRKIREIQRRMQEEIRQFQRLHRQDDAGETTEPADEQAPATEEAPPEQPPATDQPEPSPGEGQPPAPTDEEF